MSSFGLVEVRSGPVAEAAARLVAAERRFGFARDVEGGLFRLRCFAADGLPAMTPELADWVQQRLGVPPLHGRAERRSLSFAPASFSSVRELLLDDERFGVRSPDDTAWFDPSPEGTQAIAERDAALRELLALLEPAVLCRLVDDRRAPLTDVPIGAFVLAGERSGDFLLAARVSLAVQLDTRSLAKLFDADPT